MKCPSCGTENPPGGKFCISCATALQPPAAAAPPSQPPAGPPPAPPPAPVPAAPPAPTVPITPPVPPAAPPPATGTFATPPPPRGGAGPALYGLMAFVALAVVGGLIWFFVLRDTKADDSTCARSNAINSCIQPTSTPPTTGSPPPSLPPTTSPLPSPSVTDVPPSPSPSPSVTELPPPPPPPNDGKLGFIVAPCSQVTNANECKGYAFNRHVGEREFSLRLVVYNAPAGKTVYMGLIDPDTGGAYIDPNRFETDGGDFRVYVVTVTVPDGVGRIDAEIVIRFAGKPIRFDPPAVIRWR
ncbi:MAG: zinc ribbon domain-containing protein [Actinobacteria bacterium]|nr:zinc ribbon domain-containing protein [Actinomycetota bacterium]